MFIHDLSDRETLHCFSYHIGFLQLRFKTGYYLMSKLKWSDPVYFRQKFIEYIE